MDAALIASAALLGLAGAPHCTAMCSAPCAAATGGGGASATASFHIARVAGYAAGGALAAGSVATLAGWSQWSPALRPLWALLHAAALALGLWLLIQGRPPAWMAVLGSVRSAPAPVGWQRVRGPLRAGASGALWVAWPCGLLQSALLVSALGSGAVAGAAAMAAFALASSPGLLAGPWLLRRVFTRRDAASRQQAGTRLGGALLAAASAWALVHGVWDQVAAFCATL